MTELPKKITDDPYGAAILIRRLITEQGAAYWRRYLRRLRADGGLGGRHRAVGLSSSARSSTRPMSTRTCAASLSCRGVTVLIFILKGAATYGHQVILSKISNAILANNQRRLFAKLMNESVGFFSERHSSEFLARLTSGAVFGHAGAEPADQCARPRPVAVDRAGRRSC